MTELDFEQLRKIGADSRYPLMFCTVSGAHLYGFPSRDSDVDIRGAHLLPVREVVGLRLGPDTLDRMWVSDGVEFDLVTHDIGKFGRLLLGRNGNVLEMVLSPLVVVTSPMHEELIALTEGCLTKHHSHHYRGFAATEWKLFGKNGELKPLLYTFRTLLTGIHLMRTGKVVADLTVLAQEVGEAPEYLGRLVAAKVSGEHSTLDGLVDGDTLSGDVARLQGVLDEAEEGSALPERASAADGLHDLVVRARLGGGSGGG